MDAKKILVSTCLLGISLSILLHIYSPQSVAIHFNSQGIPNSWINKNNNLILWIVMYLLMTGLYLGISYVFRKAPMKLLNIPNKNYWLQPQRKDYTVSFISNLILQLGIACNIFFISLELMVFKINLREEVRLSVATANIIIGLFLGYITIWIVQFYKKFKKST